MKERKLKSLILAAFGCCFALCASAATSVFSNYGQIQNVQNYSSNPFWTPNSPYNQRMPQAIYAQGADLNTEDCLKVVQSLVSVQCMARDNCKDTSLSDIRPVVMVQLSNLPGHNYVSACAGYIDGVYESYVEQYGGNLPNKQIAFPTGTIPNPNVNGGNQIQLQNPYKIQPSQYQQEYKERSQELQYLQQQNGAGSEHLSANAFPETYADLSFSTRMENAAAGYEPYKDKSAYVIPNFKTEEEWCGTDGHLNSPECANYKKRTSSSDSQINTDGKKNNLTTDQKEIIAAIVDGFMPETQDERIFFNDLVTKYITEEDKDASLVLNNKYVYEFLSEGRNIEKYKSALLSLTGTVESEKFKIDLDWDEILIQVSTVLDATLRRRGALVCENNRSYQVGIDTALWVSTAAAAIASFGTGGVAMAGVGAGLKALAKGAAKVGLTKTGQALSKQGSKKLAQTAIKLNVRNAGKSGGLFKGWINYTGKKDALASVVAKKAGENLISKKGLLLASGAIAGTIYETAGKPAISGAQKPKKHAGHNVAGTLYSLVESEPSLEFINCHDLDEKNGCYTICGEGTTDDELNKKVFQPIMGETFCVSPEDYTLYSTKTQKPLMMNEAQYIQVTQKIRSNVMDRGKCDWNEDDVDMYLGSYIYNPDTMEPSASMIIEEFIRLDD